MNDAGLFERPVARRRIAASVAGFTLLESLIALMIGGFGLIAVARLQISLQGESDLAKQVSEATFIGQRRIEELRAYQQIASATGAQVAAGQWGYGNIASGSQVVVGTNASYTVGWTITDAVATVPFKSAVVNVQWTDRRNAAQVATLSTVISGSDPSAALGLQIPPAGTPIRRPKNRDLNVPVPAVDLGNGTSAFAPPGAPSNVRLVFSNASGALTKKCTGTGWVESGWTCTNVDGFLVTGYIAVDNQAPATLTSPIDVTVAMTLGTLDICYDDSALSTKANPGFISYTCVLIGVDHDSNPATPSRWSGQSTLTGITIGTTNSDNRICRYSSDYNGNGSIGNDEHPSTYANVAESLENQNFIVMKGSTACPTGSPAIYATVQHQP